MSGGGGPLNLWRGNPAPDLSGQYQAQIEANRAALTQQAQQQFSPETPDAQASRANIVKATTDQGNQNASDLLAAGATNHRIQEARSGGLGGRADTQGTQSLVGQYAGNVGAATAAGSQAGTQYDLQRQAQERAAEEAIRSGTINNAGQLAQQGQAFQQASSPGMLASNVIGGTAPGLAQLYANQQLIQAYQGSKGG